MNNPMTVQSKSLPHDVLATVLSDVFETAAFACVEPATKEEVMEAGLEVFERAYVAMIDLSGDRLGRLTLVLPRNLCHALTSDILGEDIGDVTEDQAADTLGELANVVAGQLVTEWLGEDVVVRLSPPLHSRIDESGCESLSSLPTAQFLCIDDEPLLVDFTTGVFS